MTSQTALIVVGLVLLVLAVLRLSRKRQPAIPGGDGKSHWIYRGGIFDLPLMKREGISRADIDAVVRKNEATLRDVREVRLEASGELSVIR